MKLKISNIKNLGIAAVLGTAMLLVSCTDLEVPVLSELVPENFPTEASHYDAAKGPVYGRLANVITSGAYWRMQTLTTDDHILPARAGNWDDGGQFREAHRHTWTADHDWAREVWDFGFSGITATNQLLSLFSSQAEGPLKDAQFAELRTMRAFYYYIMLDVFGNVPIMKSFDEDPPMSTRAEVFSFIESEILAVINNLPEEVSAKTYGRPTKWMAHTLLHRMYLNAQVYTGQPKWNEAIQHADAVINSGKFALDTDFIGMFRPNNGPQIKEFIFAIVVDAFQTGGGVYSRYSLSTELSRDKYGMGTRSQSNAHKLQPEMFDKFDWRQDATGKWVITTSDIRNQTILVGPQYAANGNPITIKTTYRNLNLDYAGPTPNRDTIWHLSFSREVWLRGDPARMDCGNDLTAQFMGARSVKFYPDPNWNPDPRNENNDFPFFRLAEVIMGKAEAIMRGGNATGGATPVSLVNQIRNRAKATPYTADQLTLDELLNERAREFQHEAHRRVDLIRFGKFHEPRLFRSEVSPTFRQLWPIPNNQLNLNPKLKQNPGYPGGS
jgi:starch-binding outer membrane protein, SusD/RagB family